MNAPVPSAAYVEAERVRAAILRALRRGLRYRFRVADAVELGRCDRQAATNALETLRVRKLIEPREAGAARYWVLTAAGREQAEP